MCKSILLPALLSLCPIAATQPPPFTISPPIQSALNRISPASLKGNLSFLASDLLEGRDTPSRGLDIAAEFIAAQFRKAGLEPGGDDGYFQTARMNLQQPNPEGFELKLSNGEKSVSPTAGQVSIRVTKEIDFSNVAIFKLDLGDGDLVEKLTPEQLDGKVVMVEYTRGSMQRGRSAFSKIRGSNPALVIVIERKVPDEIGRETAQLFDPEEKNQLSAPRLTISDDAVSRFYDGLKAGPSKTAMASAHIASPHEKVVQLRNVVGILRGSDPTLKDTCVIVSAHYDHIGQKPTGEGDRIYNGANDDGSGTVSVIELANALADLEPHPRRSIVFVTFFGEEKGLFGSRYYSHHPVFPVAKTIADLNLEQVGRTDSTEGEHKLDASVTGFDYSNVAYILKAAGGLTGIKVYKDHNSDLYFAASDNFSLAEMGIPAHSISTAFNYPDYHGVGDEWQKIDYANMAKVDKMIAVGLIMIADSIESNQDSPRWNENNPKAQHYLKVWKENHHS